MILVVGRPGLDAGGHIDRTAGWAATAAAAAGARVELVGSIGDDSNGDAAIVALGRAGIGHAALLRDPAAATPTSSSSTASLPRLDASDVELGLRYLPECHVLVLAEPLAQDARRVASAAAAYHGAPLIVVLDAGQGPLEDLPDSATQLASPDGDSAAFAALVGRYAAALEAGRPAPDAWHDALAGSGWEESGE